MNSRNKKSVGIHLKIGIFYVSNIDKKSASTVNKENRWDCLGMEQVERLVKLREVEMEWQASADVKTRVSLREESSKRNEYFEGNVMVLGAFKTEEGDGS